LKQKPPTAISSEISLTTVEKRYIMSHDALPIMLPLLILQNEKDDFVQNQRQEPRDGEKLTIVRKN
jgi:hypothetical protein